MVIFHSYAGKITRGYLTTSGASRRNDEWIGKESRKSRLQVGELGHLVRYHTISYHVILYRIKSYHIILHHIISYRIISYHIIAQIWIWYDSVVRDANCFSSPGFFCVQDGLQQCIVIDQDALGPETRIDGFPKWNHPTWISGRCAYVYIYIYAQENMYIYIYICI